MSRFARYALLAAGLLGFTQAQAQDDELLRVEEAFALTSQVVGRHQLTYRLPQNRAHRVRSTGYRQHQY